MPLDMLRTFIPRALLITLTACQAPPPPQHPASIASPKPSVDVERGVILTAPEAQVKRGETFKLLDPGHTPVSMLRHPLTPGQTASQTYELQTSVGIVIAGQRFPFRPLPRARLTVEMQIRSKGKAQDTRAEFLVTQAEPIGVEAYEPEIGRSAEEKMREIKGLMVTFAVTPTGHISNVLIKSPHGVNPSTQQLVDVIQEAFQDSIVTFPEASVGEGARWQVTQPITMGGISMWRRSTYTLESVEESRVKLAVNHEYRGKPQPMPLIDAPKGSSARLESLSGLGRATQQCDLQTATIISNSETTLELDYTYRDKDSDRAMGMRIRTRVDVKPYVASPRRKDAKGARRSSCRWPGSTTAIR